MGRKETRNSALHRKRRIQPTTLAENSIVNRQRRYLVFATVGTLLISLALEPADFYKAMINILRGLETSYTVGEQKVRLLHWDLSPTNILVAVFKGDKIYLDNKMFVRAQKNTQWAQASPRGWFSLYRTFRLGKFGGIDPVTQHIWPRVDLNWGSCRHYHQDVTSLSPCYCMDVMYAFTWRCVSRIWNW